MQQESFKNEVKRLQDEVLENAVSFLKYATTKAAQVLVDILDEDDPKTRALHSEGKTGTKKRGSSFEANESCIDLFIIMKMLKVESVAL